MPTTRKALIRLAATLPVGSSERRVILASLPRLAASYKEYIEKAKKEGKKVARAGNAK